MAAYAESVTGTPEVIDLRRLGARELDPLLLEETVEWEQTLDWDFSKSADLVRKYADMRALGGAALIDRGEVAGYGYSVVEDHKGLIGDLYIRPGWRRGEAEVRLFRMMLDGLIATPSVRRIESQLMLLEPSVAKALQRERFVRLFERILMRYEAAMPLPVSRNQQHRQFRIEPWSDHYHDEASNVIALSYEGHIDAQINDQYRSFLGARRFLYNIVQYPGCGEFHRKASFIAVESATGMVSGIVLTSFVAPQVAHVTQLCVAPRAQGTGLGYEMLRQAIALLQAGGARRISLTVTAANAAALQLYARCGFQEMRRFFAYVWEGS